MSSDGAGPLLLIPTEGEARALLDEPVVPGTPRPARVSGAPVLAALCGFGPIAAAALATEALLRSRARRCVLAGVAGTYRPDLAPVGSVVVGTEVVAADVGRRDGEVVRPPERMGFSPVPDTEEGPRIGDRLALDAPSVPGSVRGLLVTVAAASGSAETARVRAEHWPDALAEDMESYAVALAAARARARLTVLRGVSNVAGADRSGWRLEEALAALREALARLPRG